MSASAYHLMSESVRRRLAVDAVNGVAGQQIRGNTLHSKTEDGSTDGPQISTPLQRNSESTDVDQLGRKRDENLLRSNLLVGNLNPGCRPNFVWPGLSVV